MGKAKRSKKYHKSPLDGRKERKITNGEEEQQHTQKVLPLLDKLKSANAEDRSMALSAITVLAEDPTFRTILLREKLIQIVLSQILSDNSPETVLEGYGLLRNLVVELGYEIAIFLIRSDILITIDTRLQTIQQAIGNIQSKDEKRLVFESLENVLGLVSAIASTGDPKIYDLVMNKLSNLPKRLIQYLEVAIEQKNTGYSAQSLINTILEALFVLSEGNPAFTKELTNLPYEDLNSGSSPVQKAYVYGLRYNAYIASQLKKKKPKQGDAVDSVDEILVGLVDILNTINPDQIKTDLNISQADLEPSEAIKVQKIVLEARAKADAVDVVLELIAAIAETIEVDPSLLYGEAQDGQDSDNEMIDEEDEEIVDEAGDETGNETGDEDISQYLLATVLPVIVKYLEYPDHLVRTLDALNNVCWTLLTEINPSSLGSIPLDIWNNLVKYLLQNDSQVFISTLGVLAACAKALNGSVPLEFPGLDGNLINHLIGLSQTKVDTEEWIEMVSKSISLLAILAGGNQKTMEITEFLLSIITADHNIRLSLEAVNNMFDIFADKSYPYDKAVYVDRNINATLENALASLKPRVKRIDRSKEPALKEFGNETLMNLSRFIEYKRQELH